jgi:hypothetical protein
LNVNSDTESNTDLDTVSSIESTDEPIFRLTTKNITRKSTSQKIVKALKPTNTVNLTIIMPERDTEIEYENWTIEIISLIKAFYAITSTTNLNKDQSSYDRAMKGPEAS